MIRQFQSREFPTLLIASGIASSVDFGSRILCRRWRTGTRGYPHLHHRNGDRLRAATGSRIHIF